MTRSATPPAWWLRKNAERIAKDRVLLMAMTQEQRVEGGLRLSEHVSTRFTPTDTLQDRRRLSSERLAETDS